MMGRGNNFKLERMEVRQGMMKEGRKRVQLGKKRKKGHGHNKKEMEKRKSEGKQNLGWKEGRKEGANKGKRKKKNENINIIGNEMMGGKKLPVMSLF